MSSNNSSQAQQEMTITVLNYLNSRSVRGITLEEVCFKLGEKLGFADFQVRIALDDLIKKREISVSSLSQYDCISQQTINSIEVSIYSKAMKGYLTRVTELTKKSKGCTPPTASPALHSPTPQDLVRNPIVNAGLAVAAFVLLAAGAIAKRKKREKVTAAFLLAMIIAGSAAMATGQFSVALNPASNIGSVLGASVVSQSTFSVQGNQSDVNPNQPAYFVESNIFNSLGNKGISIDRSGTFSVSVVDDEHIKDRSWIIADFNQTGQYFKLGTNNANWQNFANNPSEYALRFLIQGQSSTFRLVIRDNAGKEISVPIAGNGGIIGGISAYNQAAIASFDFLKSNVAAGFNWSNVVEFRIQADQPGRMRITDIQVVHMNGNYRIAMGVAGHDLQGPGWRQRLGNYGRYFGQEPSVGTFFTTIFEPVNETSDSGDHYSDIVQRGETLRGFGEIPAVTLEFRSWAQITLSNGKDPNSVNKIETEREYFNKINAANITYDAFINNYVNQSKVLDAVNAGLLDPLLHNLARQMSSIGPVYLRLFHEPYSWFPWGIRSAGDIQKFEDAWNRVGSIFESEGANNVMFVMTFDPVEEGGASWSEVTAIKGIQEKYLSVVELDGYTDPTLRQNAYLSANELFTKKLTEIDWQLQALYPDQANRPTIALGEFAFTGDANAGKSKEQIYTWFVNDIIHGIYPITRFSILYTYEAGPRPYANSLNYSPPQEEDWSASWEPENPWYSNLLISLGNQTGFWQPTLTPTPTPTPTSTPSASPTPSPTPKITPTPTPISKPKPITTPSSTVSSPTNTTPLPTPVIPEFSSVILSLTVLMAVTIAILFRTKKRKNSLKLKILFS